MKNRHEVEGEGGFTLVETLVALVVLSLASGLLIRSVSQAAAQIASARLLSDANALSVSLLITHAHASQTRLGGTDAGTDLNWNIRTTRLEGFDLGTRSAKAILVEVEVFKKDETAVASRLNTITFPDITP
jgi:prepilin-type N-terminal cleavage/methylation domain-containing protein